MLELVSIRLLHKPTMLLSDYACCQLTFVVKPFFHCAFVYLKQIVKICCLSLYEVATRFSTQSLPQITCEQIWSTIIKQVYFCFGSCHFCIDINRISWHYCINADKPRKQSFSLSSLYSICIATHCTCRLHQNIWRSSLAVIRTYRRSKVYIGSNDAIVGRHLQATVVFHRHFRVVFIALHHVSHRHHLSVDSTHRHALVNSWAYSLFNDQFLCT